MSLEECIRQAEEDGYEIIGASNGVLHCKKSGIYTTFNYKEEL